VTVRPILLLLLLACATPVSDEPVEIPCDPAADADGDGLDDCLEEELGADPNNPDSDGDGLTDAEEVDCVSDPTDATEQCYACGWAHNDPGDLTGFGPALGDTLADISLVDQCGEEVRVHDFAGRYTILFMTAEWCGSCLGEAASLSDRGQAARDEHGIDLGYAIVIWDDFMGEIPDADAGARYADAVGVSQEIPVLSDTREDVLTHTPYDGEDLPGKCLLSPSMEILYCWIGHDNDEDAWQVAADHAAG